MNYAKTTVRVPVSILRQLKQEAARRGQTMGDLVLEGMRAVLSPVKKPAKQKLPPLPTFNMGIPNVDINDRNALYDFLDRNP